MTQARTLDGEPDAATVPPSRDRPLDSALRWLLSLGGVVALVLVFGLLTEEVLEGDTAALDRTVLLWFRDPSDLRVLLGPAWLREMLRDLTSLGSTVVLGLILALVGSYLAIARKWADLCFIVAAVLGGQVVSTVLKLSFARARPDLIPGAPEVFTASFPSGHAMLSAVTYLTLGAVLARMETKLVAKTFAVGAAAVVTVLVGVSRVALGVHWPTDVLGGWCVGVAWAATSSLVALRLRRTGRLERLA